MSDASDVHADDTDEGQTTRAWTINMQIRTINVQVHARERAFFFKRQEMLISYMALSRCKASALFGDRGVG